MTKIGFIDYVKAFVNDHAEKGVKPITKKDARAMVEGVFGALIDALTSGQEVAIPGVIKFGLNVIPERSGVSALTGQPFTTPEHLRCSVKFAKAVREEIAKATLVEAEDTDSED